MSADDWHKCPFCEKDEIEHIELVNSKYGKIPMEEWEELKEDEPDETQEQCPTVRDDNNHFLDEDGNMKVSINLKCQNCDALWKLNTVVKAVTDE